MTKINGYYVQNGTKSDFIELNEVVPDGDLPGRKQELRKKHGSVAVERGGKREYVPEIHFVKTQLKDNPISEIVKNTGGEHVFVQTSKGIPELIHSSQR